MRNILLLFLLVVPPAVANWRCVVHIEAAARSVPWASGLRSRLDDSRERRRLVKIVERLTAIMMGRARLPAERKDKHYSFASEWLGTATLKDLYNGNPGKKRDPLTFSRSRNEIQAAQGLLQEAVERNIAGRLVQVSERASPAYRDQLSTRRPSFGIGVVPLQPGFAELQDWVAKVIETEPQWKSRPVVLIGDLESDSVVQSPALLRQATAIKWTGIEDVSPLAVTHEMTNEFWTVGGSVVLAAGVVEELAKDWFYSVRWDRMQAALMGLSSELKELSETRDLDTFVLRILGFSVSAEEHYFEVFGRHSTERDAEHPPEHDKLVIRVDPRWNLISQHEMDALGLKPSVLPLFKASSRNAWTPAYYLMSDVLDTVAGHYALSAISDWIATGDLEYSPRLLAERYQPHIERQTRGSGRNSCWRSDYRRLEDGKVLTIVIGSSGC